MTLHSVAIIGARGHTGAELIRMVDAHSSLELVLVSSREHDGQQVSDHVDGFTGSLRYVCADAEAVARKAADVVVLALPNGKSAEYVQAIQSQRPEALIVDLSADHRFSEGWYYGLPELTRARYKGERRISNPGCYATAMQLAIAPLQDELAGPPQCFGVSGYSGAGTAPSERNDPEKLRDNLMPYSLVDHLHEREVSRQLGVPVEFMPHVASHFRGITMTVNLWLQRSMSVEEIRNRYLGRYGDEALVEITEDAPWVSRVAGTHCAQVGGFALAPGGRRVVVVACLDNLLKGAATQAMQNINLALGIDETSGIPTRDQS